MIPTILRTFFRAYEMFETFFLCSDVIPKNKKSGEIFEKSFCTVETNFQTSRTDAVIEKRSLIEGKLFTRRQAQLGKVPLKFYNASEIFTIKQHPQLKYLERLKMGSTEFMCVSKTIRIRFI